MLLVLLLFSQAKGKEVYIIGDSLIVCSQSYIKEFLKGHEVKIFAKVGRHFTSAFEFVDKVSPNSIVVVNLFNNSAVSYQQIVRMIGILRNWSGKPLLFKGEMKATIFTRTYLDTKSQNLQN
ncbi:MAG: hypothetical protein QXG54_04715 [Desulfurococcaceae archaeon]